MVLAGGIRESLRVEFTVGLIEIESSFFRVL
ncbi:unknown [Bacteroides sp. CAG:598]|nr:unknown [Bacteroides sp. CAG:598]